jgi:phosphatidylglycerophosphate synthase
MNSRILTVPNQLTFLRLAFLPVFIITIHYERYGWAMAILIVAGLTDGLDGWLARGLNQKTPLGAYLDPIADKLLVSSFLPRVGIAQQNRVVARNSCLGQGRVVVGRQRRCSNHRRLHCPAAKHLRKGHDFF